MSEYNFTLVIDGPTDEYLDDLFEAGCDDATFSSSNGVHYADFDREADSFSAAVASAVQDVESVDELRVTRVEPDDLVTAAEIAQRLERSRESIRLLATGRRGHGFPAPMSHGRTHNRLWRWTDVLEWAIEQGEISRETVTAMAGIDPRFVAAANGALEMRNLVRRMDSADRERVRQLYETAPQR